MKKILACLVASTMMLACFATVFATDTEEIVDEVVLVSEEVTEEAVEEVAEEVTDEEAVEEIAEEATDEEAVEEIAEEVTDEEVAEEVAEEAVDEEVVEETEIVAEVSTATVLVDGEEVAFNAYEINYNNYYKLRDVAYALNGTVAGFEVYWDAETNAIELTTGTAYTEVGGELEISELTDVTAEVTPSVIYVDGEEVVLAAYKIEGNNYFKLRDLGELFDFNVSWDEELEAIIVASDESYVDEGLIVDEEVTEEVADEEVIEEVADEEVTEEVTDEETTEEVAEEETVDEEVDEEVADETEEVEVTVE